MERPLPVLRKKLGLPPRCPILQYCGRLATTIYVFTGLEDHLRGCNPIKALQDEGIVPNDFEEKQIEPQGEAFEYSKSKFSTVYLNCCPEVNLFDDRNGIRDALAQCYECPGTQLYTSRRNVMNFLAQCHELPGEMPTSRRYSYVSKACWNFKNTHKIIKNQRN